MLSFWRFSILSVKGWEHHTLPFYICLCPNIPLVLFNLIAYVLYIPGGVIRRAEMYQEYMSQVPIPAHHGSVIPFSSWVELGKSIKQLYGQPLHYLTNITLTKWDNLRAASEYEQKPLDMMIHPCKAEATIWLVEEIHRRTTSHYHIAELWLKDRMHHTYVDSIFPKI